MSTYDIYPEQYTDEQRATVADDCRRAADLLDERGWLRSSLWIGTDSGPVKVGYRTAYDGGPMCAVGALAVARDEQAMRGLTPGQGRHYAYQTVDRCLTGKAVAAEVVARAPEIGEHEFHKDAGEVYCGPIYYYNDDYATAEGMAELLRHVATKWAPDESGATL